MPHDPLTTSTADGPLLCAIRPRRSYTLRDLVLSAVLTVLGEGAAVHPSHVVPRTDPLE